LCHLWVSNQAHDPGRTLDILLPFVPKVSMTYETILIDTHGRVGIITLNRPKALNALNAQLITEMNAALDAFQADANVAVIVLTGSDKVFAAGADIREMKDKTYADVTAEKFLWDWDHFTTIRKPIIAAVAGYALGGGCEFAMACDMLIAADTAKFSLPELSLGIIPGGGGTQRLTRAVGKAKAMDMILSGRMIDATEAERIGLVSRVVPAEKLMDEAMAIAEKIASQSQPALVAAKQAINQAFALPLSEGLKAERSLFHSMFALEDQKEGMAAFLEKRKPGFKDR
jgi:enoyl-CoA hydratase